MTIVHRGWLSVALVLLAWSIIDHQSPTHSAWWWEMTFGIVALILFSFAPDEGSR
jgi:NADH:ubiquinone oxidoreductase subunit 6 (subunit J)